MKKILILSAFLMLNAMAFASTEYKFSGQDALSQLTATHSCINCDLAGTDLSKKNLRGFDFSISNLTGADLSGADIQYVWFRDTILTGVKVDATTRMTEDQKAIFAKQGVDVSKASVVSTGISEYVFSGAAALSQLAANNSCVNCDLSGTDLSNMNLRGSDFSASNLTGANLSGADIRDAWLRGTILKNVTVTSKTQMTRQQSEIFAKQGVNVSKESIVATGASEYKFSGTAALSQLAANNSCVNCDLSGADLSNMNLRGYDFSTSNLTGVNLSGADIKDAWFKGAILKDVIVDSKTQMSQGQPAMFKKRS